MDETGGSGRTHDSGPGGGASDSASPAPRAGIPAVRVAETPRRRDGERPERSRHGRLFRSSATGPGLAPLRGRGDLFRQTVLSAAEYLGSLWPNELSDVHVETDSIPDVAGTRSGRLPRWKVDVANKRIVLYRVPIERLGATARYDEVQYRFLVESCVFQAAAEYLGKDPWDIAPDRFRN